MTQRETRSNLRSGVNLFNLPDKPLGAELTETLLKSSTVRIERIVSQGHTSPDGFWYDQNENEWVSLIEGQAVIEFQDGATQALSQGEHCLIPAHQRHRVKSTSTSPPAIWLAVFFV